MSCHANGLSDANEFEIDDHPHSPPRLLTHQSHPTAAISEPPSSSEGQLAPADRVCMAALSPRMNRSTPTRTTMVPTMRLKGAAASSKP